MKNAAYITLLLLLLVSCHSNRHLNQSATTAVDSSSSSAHKQQIQFAANFQYELNNIKLSGMLRMQEDSILWISINKIVELGRIKFTCDSIALYARFTQQYFCGDYTSARLLSGYSISFDQLQKVFLDAYKERKRNVDLVLNRENRSDTIHLVFTNYTTVHSQTYPLSIPHRARPF